MHYVMFYEFDEGYVARRGSFRPEHLRHAWEAHARGELILGGALADPVDQGLLLFNIDSPRIAEEFAAADPYVKNGLVRRYTIRPWNTVVGKDAASPVHPS
jgi:uncharacterized protein